MTRTLTKQEKIAFIESIDELSEYEKRLLLSEIEKMDTLDEIIDYIDEIYQSLYKAVTGHLQAFSEKYSQDGKLTLLMASALLTLGEKRDLQKQVAAFNKKHPKLEQPITLPEKPTRLDGLKKEVTMTMAEATEKINDKIDTHLKRTYQETYLTRTFEHAKATGKQPEIKPERLEEDIIDEIISKTFQNKRFSERIWGENQERLVNRVESLVRSDLANSLPPDDSSKVLAVEFNVARNRAVTVLQTETNNIQAEATKAEYTDDNVKKYKYLATLEVHTCEICGDLDSKIFNVKDAVRGVNYPTMHPHCRCTTVPAIEDIGGRSAKDVETGKTYTVKRGTTYHEWRKQQLEKHGITAIEDKLRAERLEKQRVTRTKLQFLEYRQLLGKDALPKTFAEFYEMKYQRQQEFKEIVADARAVKKRFEGEEQQKGNKATLVSKKYIQSAEYRRKFDELGENKKITRLIHQASKDMLFHRSGTEFEDLVFIHVPMGKVMTQNNYDEVRTVQATEKMMKFVKSHPNEVVAIHNHPGSSLPSWADLNVAVNRGYKYGIIVGHDGTVFKYSVSDLKIDDYMYNVTIDKWNKKYYNDTEKKIIDTLKIFGIKVEVL